jgi:hypothetical protein
MHAAIMKEASFASAILEAIMLVLLLQVIHEICH